MYSVTFSYLIGTGTRISHKKQAEKWAKRKSIRQNKIAIVNVYELNDELSRCKVKRFDQEDEVWLDFVCACRDGKPANKEYDVIIGNVADDDVFKTVDMYFRGIWNKERALEELRYSRSNDQICFAKQKAINAQLRFVKSYQVVKNHD